jgi:hypothetical protein
MTSVTLLNNCPLTETLVVWGQGSPVQNLQYKENEMCRKREIEG